MVSRKKERTAITTVRDRIDAGLVIASLVLLSILTAMSKFEFFDKLLGLDGNVETGSIATQILWGLVYAHAAWRLVGLRVQAAPLIRRSLPLVAFLILIALSYAWSVDPWVTFRNSTEMIGTTTLCYYVVVRFTLREFLDILVKYFTGIAVVSFLLVFLWPSHGRSTGGVVGWCGLFSEKNGFGAAMGLAIVTYAIALATASDKRKKAFLTGCLALALVLFIGAQSTTASIVLTVTSIVVLTAVGSSTRNYGGTVLIAAAITATGGIIFVLTTGIDSAAFFEMIGKTSTLTGRTEFWPGIIRAIGDRPILGFGYNAFFFTQSTVQEYIAGLTGWWIPLTAHNSYYQMILSIGYIGITIFSFAVGPAVFVSLMQVVRERSILAAWPFAILLYSLLGSFTEVYVGIPNAIGSICFTIAILYPFRALKGRPPAVSSQPLPKKRLLEELQQPISV